MNRAALLLLLVAALAGAAYFVLGSGDSGAATGGTIGLSRGGDTETNSAADQGPDDLMAPDATIEDGDRTEMSFGAKTETSDGPRKSSEEGQSAPMNRRGTLSGRVTDGEGAPLAGASVAVVRRDLGDLFASVRDSGTTEGEPRATTEADGSFSITTRSGALRVNVEADGFAPYSVAANVAGDAEEDLGDLRLALGVILRGRIVDGSGDGIAGATLQRAPTSEDGITIFGGDVTPVAVSDAGGEFEVVRQAPGPYHFHVTHPEYPPVELEGATEQAGETVANLRVVMEIGGAVRGVVLGAPAGSTGLFAHAELGEGSSGTMSFSTGPSTGRSTPVGPDGSFELRGLARGMQYQVYLREGGGTFMEGGRRSFSVPVIVPKKGIAPTLQIPFSLGSSVRFTVVDEAGAPRIPDRIEAGFDYAMRREDAETDAKTGACLVAGLWPDADGQPLLLNLVAQGFEKWEAQGLMLHQDEPLDLGRIVLVARPSVRVTVVDDATGEPVEGATVQMMPPPQEGDSRSMRISARLGDDDENEDLPEFDEDAKESGTTDAGGVCSLDASAGATVILTVRDAMHAPATVGPITLPESMQVFEQEVRLDEGGALRIVAREPSGAPAPSYSVEFREDGRDEHDQHTQRTGEDGVLELTGLRAGEHLLRIGGRGTATMFMPRIRIEGMEPTEDDGEAWTSVVVLPGETVEVTIEAPAIGVLTGKVLERGVELGSAKLKLKKLGDENPLAGLIMLGGSGAPSATSDAHGDFRLADIEAGDYELVVEHPTRAMPFTMPIEIEGGEQEIELGLTVTEVTGRVLDHEGEPLAGARVEAQRAPKEGAPRRNAVSMVMMTSSSGGSAGVMMSTGEDETEPVTTDAEGKYRLRGVVHGEDLLVTASAKGYDEVKSEPFRVGEGGVESDVDLRFVKAGSIRNEVEGSTGPLVALIRRRRAGRPAPPKVEMMTSETKTVDSLGPGTWTVTLQSANGGQISVDPDEVEVEVVGGETAVASFKVQG